MSELIALTEFYKKEGFSGKDAVEKAEKQLERERERERVALEIRKMEHEEKMRGISCHHIFFLLVCSMLWFFYEIFISFLLFLILDFFYFHL